MDYLHSFLYPFIFCSIKMFWESGKIIQRNRVYTVHIRGCIFDPKHRMIPEHNMVSWVKLMSPKYCWGVPHPVKKRVSNYWVLVFCQQYFRLWSYTIYNVWKFNANKVEKGLWLSGDGVMVGKNSKQLNNNKQLFQPIINTLKPIDCGNILKWWHS